MTEKVKILGSKPASAEMHFWQNGMASEECPFEVQTCSGLTKREYFAAMAMQALHANFGANRLTGAEIAKKAVAYADALLEELSK